MTRVAGLTALLLASACASSSPSPAPAAEETEALVWPAAPAPPRVRHRAVFPKPAAAAPPRSFLSRVWNLVLGRDQPRPETPGLVRPFGVASDGTGFLIADPEARRVVRVDRRGGTFRTIECRRGPWIAPIAVAIDGTAIWVADAGAGTIARIDASGGCTHIGAERLHRPSGIALSEGLVWVVDPPAHAVVALAPDGTEKRRLGSRGEDEGKLNFPTAIAVAPDGTLVVVDALNFRVSRFSTDGRHIESFGGPGDAGGAFGRPKAVAVDELGRIYVTDVYRDLVLVFSPDGHFELSFGGSGGEAGRLAMPAGIAIDRDMLYVADSYGRRVQLYELVGGEP